MGLRPPTTSSEPSTATGFLLDIERFDRDLSGHVRCLVIGLTRRLAGRE